MDRGTNTAISPFSPTTPPCDGDDHSARPTLVLDQLLETCR
ncbi:hypothetical protein MKSMC1_29870 [Mycobacterium kansasii]|nr:hypothetical protein MKSMC1_29870 [Mycobacterium kansasii]